MTFERGYLCCDTCFELLSCVQRGVNVQADSVPETPNDGHDIPSVVVEEVVRDASQQEVVGGEVPPLRHSAGMAQRQIQVEVDIVSEQDRRLVGRFGEPSEAPTACDQIVDQIAVHIE